MAGAGFKTFNTGDVLTASDVNTYLMQQTVMVFADASARSTALGANVAEGMISYLKDTNAVERYDGSSWGAIGAGDITGVTAGTGLTGGGTSGAVTLDFDVANYGGGQKAAGKNKIINGDFGIWQRGTSFTLSSAVVTYTADRFVCYADGTVTCTASRQAFTAGTAPVSGYESQYFLRTNTTAQSGGSGTYQGQRIEDVRTFAGQTITFSLWAKADSARTYNLYLAQNFGSGGSATVNTSAQSISVTTSWQRFSFTVTLGSISGKTIGTGSSLEAWIYGAANTANTLDTWGWQVEAGSTTTSFQTATGTIQGELAACQRYYYRALNDADNRSLNGLGWADSATAVVIQTTFPVPMRIRPTGVETTGTASNYLLAGSGLAANATAVTFDGVTTDQVGCTVFTISGGGTAGRVVQLRSSGANRYIAWSAEL